MIYFMVFQSLVLADLEISYIYPIPVSGIRMAWVRSLNETVFFSGRESSIYFQNTLEFFKLSSSNSLEDFRSSPATKSPDPRSLYGLCYDADANWILIYGGVGVNGIYGDLWVYIIDTDTWEDIYKDIKLPARFDFGFNCIYDKENLKIHIIGGMDQFELKSDAIIFTYNKNTKEKHFNIINYSNFIGYPITGLQIQYYQNNLLFFSGYGFRNGTKVYFQDLMSCDLILKNCKSFKISNKLYPSTDGGSGIQGSFLYYFFGQDDKGPVNQIYFLDLQSPTLSWSTLHSNPDVDCSRSLFGFTQIYLQLNSPTLNFFGGTTRDSNSNSFGSIIFNSSQATITCTSPKKNPERRNKGSMVQISQSLLLFGGRNGNFFFNELWTVDFPGLNTWTLIKVLGEYPVPRISHAASAKGNFMLVVGGYDENFDILADYWLLERKVNRTENRFFYQWKNLEIDEDSVKPPPITETCAMIEFPFFFYVGGRNTNGLTSDLWKFDLTISRFSRFQMPSDIPDISRHGCHLAYENYQKFIYLFFGAVSVIGEPSNVIYKVNITDLNNIKTVRKEYISQITPRFDFAYTVIRNILFVAGGQAYFSQSYNDLWAVNLVLFNVTAVDMMIDSSFHSTNFASIAGNFYIFSGLEGNGEPTFSESSSTIIKYNQLHQAQNLCGKGYFFNNSLTLCVPCSPGTYKSESDNFCVDCPSGTYNPILAATDIIQCLPCDYGFYNNKPGKETCTKCPEDKVCFVGSINYINKINDFLETQPDLIEPGDTSRFIIILLIVSGSLLLVFTALWLFLLRFQVLLSVYDLFSDDHVERPSDPEEERLSEQYKSKYSNLGGYFTGFTFVVIAAITTYYIYIYANENVEETVKLVPSNTLADKKGFKDEALNIFIGFNSLRYNSSSCNSIRPTFKSSKKLKVTFDESYTLNTQTFTFCGYKYEVKKSSTFETGESILFSFEKNCKECYTSDIRVSVEARSAYHNKKSQYSQSIDLLDGNVLKGAQFSKFYFGLIPAFYQDYTGKYLKNHYGYRVTELFSPDIGSVCTPSEIYFNSGLSIKVEFSLSQTGIYTSATLKFDWFGFFGVAVGAISGTIGLIAFFMQILEHSYFRYRYRHLKKESAIKVEYQRKIRSIQKKKNKEVMANL